MRAWASLRSSRLPCASNTEIPSVTALKTAFSRAASSADSCPIGAPPPVALEVDESVLPGSLEKSGSDLTSRAPFATRAAKGVLDQGQSRPLAGRRASARREPLPGVDDRVWVERHRLDAL